MKRRLFLTGKGLDLHERVTHSLEVTDQRTVCTTQTVTKMLLAE